MKKIFSGLCLMAATSLTLPADVTLPKILTNHMVIQRDAPITIWGWADAGEKVTVQLASGSAPNQPKTQAQTRANEKGEWQLVLPQRGLSKTPLEMKVTGHNTITLKDILMGDVWLCSGQSNMEWGIARSEAGKKEIAAADHPTLRLYDVGKVATRKPQKDIVKGSGWKVCTPQTVANTGTAGGFSAVAYYFGQSLQSSMPGVPIGLIDSSWGGSNIQPWTTHAGWQTVPALVPNYRKMKALDLLKQKPNNHSAFPSLYNGMIHGLRHKQIKGCLWYQGESNRHDGALYHQRKLALVNGWRQIWGEKMPFYFVQLAPFSYPRDKNPEVLPIFWQAQAKSNQLIPHTGMAVTIDVGNDKNIHPKKKRQVGERLAVLALKETYGKDLVAHSPTYQSHQRKGKQLLVRFDHVGSGLVSRDSQPLSGFEIAGANGKFVPAQATISSKNTLTLSSPEISEPSQFRFAWSNTPKVNLMNREGLPAGSFRSAESR